MAKTDLAVLKYWRSSLADSAIGDACLTSKMLEDFHSVSRKEAETGVLEQDAIDFLFGEVPSHVRRIARWIIFSLAITVTRRSSASPR
jgi:hypothetical protein